MPARSAQVRPGCWGYLSPVQVTRRSPGLYVSSFSCASDDHRGVADASVQLRVTEMPFWDGTLKDGMNRIDGKCGMKNSLYQVDLPTNLGKGGVRVIKGELSPGVGRGGLSWA